MSQQKQAPQPTEKSVQAVLACLTKEPKWIQFLIADCELSRPTVERVLQTLKADGRAKSRRRRVEVTVGDLWSHQKHVYRVYWQLVPEEPPKKAKTLAAPPAREGWSVVQRGEPALRKLLKDGHGAVDQITVKLGDIRFGRAQVRRGKRLELHSRDTGWVPVRYKIEPDRLLVRLAN